MSIKVLIYWEITLGAARPLTFASFSEKAYKTKQNNHRLTTATVLSNCFPIDGSQWQGIIVTARAQAELAESNCAYP